MVSDGDRPMEERLLKLVLAAIALMVALAAACSSSDGDDGQVGAAADAGGGARSADVYKLTQEFVVNINVTSSKFNETRRIPRTYSCEREDISPPITWGDVPDGTVSLALLMESNQVPGPLWTHWLLWGIPPDARGLPEAVPNTPAVPSIGPNAVQGTNSDDKVGWSGPCKEGLLLDYMPRSLEQRRARARLTSDYFFRVYALDTDITLGSDATKGDFLRAIDGHILAGGELVGQQTGVTYSPP